MRHDVLHAPNIRTRRRAASRGSTLVVPIDGALKLTSLLTLVASETVLSLAEAPCERGEEGEGKDDLCCAVLHVAILYPSLGGLSIRKADLLGYFPSHAIGNFFCFGLGLLYRHFPYIRDSMAIMLYGYFNVTIEALADFNCCYHTIPIGIRYP